MGRDTSQAQENLDEALFVMRQDACTYFDLELYRIREENPDWDNDIKTEGLVHGQTKYRQVMSKMGQSMQDGIKLSQTSRDSVSGITKR